LLVERLFFLLNAAFAMAILDLISHIHLPSSVNMLRRYLKFEMWCWRRMEKISWTDHVRNEEVLLRVNEQRNILHEISKRKAKWIGHILCRNCLLQGVIEGKIKGTDRSDKKTRKKTCDVTGRS